MKSLERLLFREEDMLTGPKKIHDMDRVLSLSVKPDMCWHIF